jgi:hypothetical protein
MSPTGLFPIHLKLLLGVFSSNFSVESIEKRKEKEKHFLSCILFQGVYVG